MNHLDTDAKDKGVDGSHHHRGKSSENLFDRQIILRHLGIRPGQAILDAGCGSGYMSKALSEVLGKSGRVYALDPDEAAIAKLREETRGTNILPMVGDITVTTIFPEASLDLVYLSAVFHGFSPEQIEGFDKEVNRILKPGARLAIVEIVKRYTPFGPPLQIRFSPDDLKRVISLLPLATAEVGDRFYMQLFEKPNAT